MRKGIELNWTDYAWTWVVMVAFVITIISQVAIFCGRFGESETQKQEGVVNTKELEKPWSSHTDRGAYYFREKGR